MAMEPLRPGEHRLILQARIEGITLVQLFIRDKLVQDRVLDRDKATAYVKRLTGAEQLAQIFVLFTPEEELGIHYL